MSAHRNDDDQAVLDMIMADGTFDELRNKVMNEIKNDPELLRFTEEQIRGSSDLSDYAFDGADEKQLFDELRRDDQIQKAVSEKMIAKLWAIAGGEQSAVSKLIEEKVHEKLCAVYEQRQHSSQSAAAGNQHRI